MKSLIMYGLDKVVEIEVPNGHIKGEHPHIRSRSTPAFTAGGGIPSWPGSREKPRKAKLTASACETPSTASCAGVHPVDVMLLMRHAQPGGMQLTLGLYGDEAALLQRKRQAIASMMGWIRRQRQGDSDAGRGSA